MVANARAVLKRVRRPPKAGEPLDNFVRVEAGELNSESDEEVQMASEVCTHLDQVRDVTPSARGCEDCLKTGDTWVHLRLCRSCGHVGCCDSSKNKHATKHFRASGHPIIRSFERGEDWGWCYVDEIFFEPAV
jgi:uncharacterized UBP type Zn finger protein